MGTMLKPVSPKKQRGIINSRECVLPGDFLAFLLHNQPNHFEQTCNSYFKQFCTHIEFSKFSHIKPYENIIQNHIKREPRKSKSIP